MTVGGEIILHPLFYWFPSASCLEAFAMRSFIGDLDMHASVPPKTMWNKWLIWGMINLNKRQNLFLFMNLSPFYFHHHPVHHKSSSIKVLWRYLLHWTKWQQLHDAYFAEFSYGVENEVFFPTHLFKNMRLKWKQLGSTENVHKKKESGACAEFFASWER